MSDIPYQSAHRLGGTINVWVYVQTATGVPEALVSPFWVPKGIYTLVWNLVTLQLNEGAPLATFADPGIVLSIGENQKLTVLQQGLSSETQYWISVDNFQAEEPALLGYDIYFGKDLNVRAVYDPTIIVSKDPVDPPAATQSTQS